MTKSPLDSAFILLALTGLVASAAMAVIVNSNPASLIPPPAPKFSRPYGKGGGTITNLVYICDLPDDQYIRCRLQDVMTKEILGDTGTNKWVITPHPTFVLTNDGTSHPFLRVFVSRL